MYSLKYANDAADAKEQNENVSLRNECLYQNFRPCLNYSD